MLADSDSSAPNSQALVHASCLRKFYVARGAWGNLHCPECKTMWEGPVTERMIALAVTTAL